MTVIATTQEPSMPQTWDDPAGWNGYYAAVLGAGNTADPDEGLGSLHGDCLAQLAKQLRDLGWSKVWIPGCGLSTMPARLARFGLTVYATDFASVAIDYQSRQTVRACLTEADTADSIGAVRAEIHDLRTPFRQEAFDFLINTRAFSRFRPQDMPTIARVCCQALKPGRQAIFDTLNVQGSLRDQMEQSLADGGFAVPFLDFKLACRQALRDTGIPHVFVLGRPMIPQVDEYGQTVERWHDESWRKPAQEQLHRIAAEYETKMRQSQTTIAPDARIAQIIYSTG